MITPEKKEYFGEIKASPDNPVRFDECVDLVDKSIYGLQLTSEFIKLPQVDKILENLIYLKQIIQPALRDMIMAELIKDNFKPFTLGIGEVCWEISITKVDIPKPELKKKWWKFNKSK
jgi:hypothetical protein